MKNKILISIDEVAKFFKISKATVNYYTNLGILRIADKEGNKRLYDKKRIKMALDKIKLLRKQGYTLKLIQQSSLNFYKSGRLSLK